MRVFVTGASGFIGSAIVQELLNNNHQVVGLARSDKSAAAVAAAGAEVHRGSIDDAHSLRAGVAKADAVIHTAFNHDFSKFKENCENDRRVIAALGEGLVGSARPLVVTSGLAILPKGKLVSEDAMPATGPAAHPRAASEEAARGIGAQGVNVSIVRLPPTVHGAGDYQFIPLLIDLARRNGLAVHVGDGSNRWPAVHRLDAARLYRLAVEKAANGVCYHAVGEEGVPFRDIAVVIGQGLNVPVVSKTPEEAAAYFGWFQHFAAMDIPASSAKTSAALGWEPKEAGLIADIQQAGYFNSAP